jgi:hypothetical protein
MESERLKRVAIALALAMVQPAWAETVHSLDQVKPHLKTPEARKTFSEQMEGKPAPDLLGIHLSAPLTSSALTTLLIPAGDTAKVNLVGAKPWPVRPDQSLAIVCTGGTAPYSASDPSCQRSLVQDDDIKEPPLHVYLGLVEARQGAPASLVAASGPIDCATDWGKSDLPQQPMAANDAKNGIIDFANVEQFDLAPYKIAPDQPAFGLRVSWMEGYSGGGANFGGLCLFTVDGDRLKQVLAVPMSADADIAGDWHKDGTRDHDITDAANLLIVSSHVTNGHFDLIVKSRAGGAQHVYRWAKEAGAYKSESK